MNDRHRKNWLKRRRGGDAGKSGPPDQAPPDKSGHGEPASEFEELFCALWDAAVITDSSGCVFDSNSRAEGWFGYSRREFRGLTVADFISGANDSLMRTILANIEETFVFIEECYCLRKDGSIFPAEMAVNRLRLSNDHLIFFVRDITNRKELESRNKKANS